MTGTCILFLVLDKNILRVTILIHHKTMPGNIQKPYENQFSKIPKDLTTRGGEGRGGIWREAFLQKKTRNMASVCSRIEK